MLATMQARTAPPPPASLLPAPGAAAAPHLLAPLEPLGVTIRADRDEEIVAQGDPAGYCYVVLSGCLRTVSLMDDGRRQVGEFLFAGALFGWEALDTYDFAAEAVTPVVLRRYPRRSLELLADRDAGFARRLRAVIAAQMRAGRERLVLLGRKTASERIATFLLEMATRLGSDATSLIELPMGRADMADYLGLTVETVCRGLGRFGRSGAITVDRARVTIRDRRALGVAGCEFMH
ncbi:MAG TPA: helix-turn-helix domain-containing protein [Acetobacteraceae bacterium]|nr:helix-turn-helix domain-containing protein [Acetobacteraceae bacterium]